MNYQLFLRLYSEALSYNDIDMFTAERGWQDWMDNYTPEKVAKMLLSIYELATSTIKEIRENRKISRAKFARDFQIPIRTLEDWDANKREAPAYVEILVKYAIFESEQYESNE